MADYDAGEALLLAVVQESADFDATNTDRANTFSKLNSGKSDHYAILRRGASDNEWITPDTYVTHWRTIVDVWLLFKLEGTDNTRLYDYVDGIVAKIMAKPRLGGSIDDSFIEGISEVENRWLSEGGPQWIAETITVRWDEETTVAFS